MYEALNKIYFVHLATIIITGLVAQRIPRLTTDQKIAGSNPAEFAIGSFVCLLYVVDL